MGHIQTRGDVDMVALNEGIVVGIKLAIRARLLTMGTRQIGIGTRWRAVSGQ